MIDIEEIMEPGLLALNAKRARELALALQFAINDLAKLEAVKEKAIEHILMIARHNENWNIGCDRCAYMRTCDPEEGTKAECYRGIEIKLRADVEADEREREATK